jgi:antitoxin ParD1/3/4
LIQDIDLQILIHHASNAIICANIVIAVRCHTERSVHMNVSIGKRWEEFVEKTVEDGRYSSASEVVREGLRLVEEREAKIAALRHHIEESIAGGGDISEEEMDAALDAAEAELVKQGY